MVKVHATSGATVPAGVKAAAPESSSDVFAAVFESARQSARAASEERVRAREGSGRAPSAKAKQTREKADAEKPAETHDDRDVQRSEHADKPTKAERPREKASAHTDAGRSRTEAEEAGAKDAGHDAKVGADGGEASVAARPAEASLESEGAPPPAATVAQTPAAQGGAAPPPAGSPEGLAGGSMANALTLPTGQAATLAGDAAAPAGGNQTSAQPVQAVTPAMNLAAVSSMPATGKAEGNGSQATARQSGEQPGGPQPHFQNVLDAQVGAKGTAPHGRLNATAINGKAASATTVSMKEPGSVSELTGVVRSAIGNGRSNMLLRLDPPELGQVQVDVRMDRGVLTLKFEAQTPAGQEALQSKLNELRGALEQHGIQVSGMEVDLRPPPAPQHPSGEQSTPQQQGWNGGHAFGGSQGQQSDGREQGTWQGSAGAMTEAPGDALRSVVSWAEGLDLVA